MLRAQCLQKPISIEARFQRMTKEMAYGESNITCPMTSRDVKWSRLSNIFVINSRNKGTTVAYILRHFAPYFAKLL